MKIAPTSAMMPSYKCHKTVKALQISDIFGTNLVFQNGDFGPLEMPPEWMDKHQPKAGGYYVVYEDGYESYSPQKAFEEGYTLISEHRMD
jgi:hypothetical protein